MLTGMIELLDEARKNGNAVGAFNVTGLETVAAVVSAAEELGVPVILAFAQMHSVFIRAEEIAPIMLDYAKRASVPVCVHFDHGTTFEGCVEAIRLGFTSIMYDASVKPYEQNVAETAEIVKIAHALGIGVEAELGQMFTSAVGGGEGRGPVDESSFETLDDCYTDPELARDFVERTGVDALAIAFGTTHGVYLKEPRLDFGRIAAIRETTGLPLVMHGGSGVSDEDYRNAIGQGIAKINYYTYMAKAGGEAVADYVERARAAGETAFFHDVAAVGIDVMKQDALRAMRVFEGVN